MSKVTRTILFSLMLMFLSGCGGRYVPDKFARIEPLDAISVPSYKGQVGCVTTFLAVMDPGLFSEAVVLEDSAGMIKIYGVWSVFALDENYDLVKGDAVFWGPNRWGDYIFRALFKGNECLSDKSSMLISNRDGSRFFNLKGVEIDNYLNTRGAALIKAANDGKAFRIGLFRERGTSLSALMNFWQSYLVEKGDQEFYVPEAYVAKLKIGGPRWNEFLKQLSIIMPCAYKTFQNDRQSGVCNESEFKRISTEPTRVDPKERFFMNASKVPIGLFPLGPIPWSAKLISDLLNANLDTDWSGYLGAAKISRDSHVDTFRYQAQIGRALAEAGRENKRQRYPTPQ